MNYWSISSQILTREAALLGLEVSIISKNKNLFSIEGNGKKILFKSTDFGGNSALGLKLSDDKELTDNILDLDNIPTAKSHYLTIDDLDTLSGLNIVYPAVIKPVEEGHGNGIMMNILDYGELKEKLEESFLVYDNMIVQQQIEGEEYRILILNGETLIAINRIPAFVIGDGESSINKLIDIENSTNELRGDGYDKTLANILIDKELVSFIGKQGLNIESMISKDERITLRGNSNLGYGGIPVDVTSKIHPSILETAYNSAAVLGLQFAGVDVITTDITKPLEESGGIILEVNSTPGLGGDLECTGINTGKIMLQKIFF